MTSAAATRVGVELLARDAQELARLHRRRSEPSGSLRGLRRDLEETAAQIDASLTGWATAGPDAGALRTGLTAMFDRLDAGLRDYQRYANAD